MPLAAPAFTDSGLPAAAISALIDRHDSLTLPQLRHLWSYYRNPILTSTHSAAGHAPRRSRLAQERGLPARLINPAAAQGLARDDRGAGREIVIENDIAWRIQTMVDFMFGRPVAITSTARDPTLRRTIDRLLDAVWESSGGVALLSDIGLLGHVYGHVDLLVRTDLTPLGRAPGTDDERLELARRIRIEPVEPTRAIPLTDPDDYRRLAAYIVRSTRVSATSSPQSGPAAPARLTRWLARGLAPNPQPDTETLTEVLTASHRRLYLQADPDSAPRLIHSGPALVSEPDLDGHDAPVPVVHIQNISQPFQYDGLSEVEPLIPLQDELNTRLSDRASRVTMQSFKMYLAKGLDGFDRIPVGPGQVWATDNPDASVQAFGGDGASPSEDAHIEGVREALDKASGVPPLASGVVRAKIGNLTSENALRVTLMGLLSKTARKRVTYGRGMVQASALVLLALHRAGILETNPADRQVRVGWPDPLPRDERETLDAAQRKLDLGIPRERVLSELGYAPTDPGIV